MDRGGPSNPAALRDCLRLALRGRRKQRRCDPRAVGARPTPAAVLVPLLVKGCQVRVLFTRRTETVSRHKGQISFPGGAREASDASLVETALRETEEEVGVHRAAVEVLGELDDYVTSSNYLVTPFVGWLAPGVPYRPDPREVAEILEIPLDVVRDPARLEVCEVERGGRRFPGYHYHADECIIWGITGRILRQLLVVLEGSEDGSRPVPERRPIP